MDRIMKIIVPSWRLVTDVMIKRSPHILINHNGEHTPYLNPKRFWAPIFGYSQFGLVEFGVIPFNEKSK